MPPCPQRTSPSRYLPRMYGRYPTHHSTSKSARPSRGISLGQKAANHPCTHISYCIPHRGCQGAGVGGEASVSQGKRAGHEANRGTCRRESRVGGDPGHSAWSECLAGGKGTEAEAAAHARKPTTNAISDIQGPSPKVTGSSSTIMDRVHSH